MKINLGVMFGGKSVEHEVSVVSALQAIASIDKNKYEIVPIYISKAGDFFTGDRLLDIDEYKDIDNLMKVTTKVVPVKDSKSVYLYKHPEKGFKIKKLVRVDFILPIVHGTNCEDGTLQGYLEMLGIPYAGCDVLSSALGMDKVSMKEVFKSNGIPVVEYCSFYSYDWDVRRDDIISQIEEGLGYPCVVKPANLGSSIGITKAKNKDELIDAIDLAESFALKILVEKAVVGLREINCSVLGDAEEALASACEEPMSHDEILTYSEKYLSESNSKGGKNSNSSGSKGGMASATRKLPAELSKEKEQEIKDYAVKSFQSLGCCGVSRIDFMLDTEDDDKVYVNEINTIPGSLSFYLWEATGKSYKELLDEIIDLGFKRARDKEKLMVTYDSNIFKMNSFGGFKGKK